jgi:predicted P-loop ATPase
MTSAFKAEIQVHGAPLHQRHYTALAARWISREYADGALLRYADTALGAELVGQSGAGDYSGILIPYLWPGDLHVRDYRLRREHPELVQGNDGTLKLYRKYLCPPGRGGMIYMPPAIEPAWLGDVTMPLAMTEGEFKALALFRLAWFAAGDTAETPGFLPAGLQGVWNWRGTVGKKEDAEGRRVDVKGPISDLSRIAWDGRSVTVIFDADTQRNPKVVDARRRLTQELESRGAIVSWFDFPKGNPQDRNGIDDLLAAVGPEEVLERFMKARPRTPLKARSSSVATVTAAGWQAALLRTSNGYIKPILANAIAALSSAPEWDGVLAFDDFSQHVVAQRATPWSPIALVWSDTDDIRLAEWLQRQGIEVTPHVAGHAVQACGQNLRVHPVREYLSSLQWDRRRRLNTWLQRYLGAKPDDDNARYLTAVGSRFLISAVARVMKPGCKADHCLILEGAQGIRKSTALRTLAGNWFTDEVSDLGSKDAAMQVSGVWICELAELDAMSRLEAGRVKAFLSRSVDRYRPPYGHRVIEVPRQCVFAGSVNHSDYLRDETGGRRFWPVACGVIDIDGLAHDRDQLWAEALVRFQAGEPWWLDTHHLIAQATTEQEARYQADVWLDKVHELTELRPNVSVAEVLAGLLVPTERQTQTDANRVARCLKSLGWIRRRPGTRASRSWRYFPPTTDSTQAVVAETPEQLRKGCAEPDSQPEKSS